MARRERTTNAELRRENRRWRESAQWSEEEAKRTRCQLQIALSDLASSGYVRAEQPAPLDLGHGRVYQGRRKEGSDKMPWDAVGVNALSDVVLDDIRVRAREILSASIRSITREVSKELFTKISRKLADKIESDHKKLWRYIDKRTIKRTPRAKTDG